MAQKIEAPRLVDSLQSKSPYGLLAGGIEALHTNCSPITELEIHGQKIEVPNDKLHGFSIAWPVWYNPPLPTSAKEFLKEGIDSRNHWLNISTSVFGLAKNEYWDASKPRNLENAYPLPTQELLSVESIGIEQIGQDAHHILTLSTTKRQLEIEVKRESYFGEEFYELINPCLLLAVRFLTIGENGMIQRHTQPPSDSAEFYKWVRRHDDPRNFYLEDGVPSQEQMGFVTEVLQFTLTERERQISS